MPTVSEQYLGTLSEVCELLELAFKGRDNTGKHGSRAGVQVAIVREQELRVCCTGCRPDRTRSSPNPSPN